MVAAVQPPAKPPAKPLNRRKSVFRPVDPSQPDGQTLAIPIDSLCRQGPFRQVCQIQRLLLADLQNPSTEPADRASLARAFDTLEERKRVLKMKFKPGDLRAADLDPARADWIARRFRKANQKHLGHLPKELFIEAEVVPPPAKVKALPPAPSPVEPDRLPGDVTP